MSLSSAEPQTALAPYENPDVRDEEVVEREELKAKYTALDRSTDISRRAIDSRAHGSFADIFLGDCTTDALPRVPLALKVIRAGMVPTVDERAKILKRLRQEISVWHAAEHPNIHSLLGLWWNPDWAFPAMVSKWEEKGNLRQYRDMTKPTPSQATILELLGGVLEGLRYLHGKSIIHADIKAENVLVSSDLQAQLCDFGLSWSSIKRSVSFSSDRSGKGTITHMAPEFFASGNPTPPSGDSLYTVASDVWAFGCLFNEATTGKSLWSDHTSNQVFMAMIKGERFTRPPNVADDLWDVVECCCQVKAEDRSSTSNLIEMLKRLRASRLDAEAATS